MAAGALISSMSIANAQNSQSQVAPVGSPNPLMSNVVGKSKFCLQTEGTLTCKYASMDACQKAGRARNQQCIANPNTGTTGQR
jgi:hypothetical protein